MGGYIGGSRLACCSTQVRLLPVCRQGKVSTGLDLAAKRSSSSQAAHHCDCCYLTQGQCGFNRAHFN